MLRKFFQRLAGNNRVKLPHFLSSEECRPLFRESEFCSRPDWPEVWKFAKSQPGEKRDRYWQDFAFHWLSLLAEEFGQPYRVDWSRNFIALTSRDSRRANLLLQLAEHQLARILGLTGRKNKADGRGFYTLLVLDSQRLYEQYISHFGPEGAEAVSGGMFIGSKYYGHIVLRGGDSRILEITLAHELTHNALWPSRLPLWVEEGLCQISEELIAAAYREPLNRKRADKHRDFWLHHGLDDFWSGRSFGSPKAQELSYELAVILVKSLSSRTQDMSGFLASAEWRDAGFGAAQSELGLDLAEVVAEFLGPDPERSTLF